MSGVDLAAVAVCGVWVWVIGTDVLLGEIDDTMAALWPLWVPLWLLVATPKAVAWALRYGIPNAARTFAREFPRILP